MNDKSPYDPTTWGEDSLPNEPHDPTLFDDDLWDAFLPDEELNDPLPEPGDFWVEDELTETREGLQQP